MHCTTAVLLLVASAVSAREKSVVVIDDQPLAITDTVPASSLLAVRNLRFFQATNTKTGAAVQVAKGYLVSDLPSDQKTVTVDIHLVETNESRSYTRTKAVMSATVVNPKRGKPIQFISASTPVYADWGAKRRAEGRLIGYHISFKVEHTSQTGR